MSHHRKDNRTLDEIVTDIQEDLYLLREAAHDERTRADEMAAELESERYYHNTLAEKNEANNETIHALIEDAEAFALTLERYETNMIEGTDFITRAKDFRDSFNHTIQEWYSKP